MGKEIKERYFTYHQLYQDLKQNNEIQAIKKLYRLADFYISQDFNVFNTKVACHKGCSFCCRIPVNVSEDEVNYILDYVKKNDISINFKNRDKKNPANNKFETCVFLDTQKNTCKIYKARPIACRKHFVTTTAEHCKDLSEKIGRYYPFEPDLISLVLYNSSKIGNLNKLVEEKFHSINTLSYKIKCFIRKYLLSFI